MQGKAPAGWPKNRPVGLQFYLSVAPPWGYGRPGVAKKKARHFFYVSCPIQPCAAYTTYTTCVPSATYTTDPPVLSYVCSMLFALPVALQSYWYCYSKEGIFLICVMSLVFEGNTHRTKEIVEVEDEVR